MNSQAGSIELATSPAVTRPRPMYWSVRRELWENRFLWIVPSAVALVVLITGILTSLIALARSSGAPLTELPPAIMKHFHMGPAPIMLCSLLVGLFYALDALYGERRDRSILFWKSLPVSDSTSVMAKILIPIAVLPALAIALSVVSQLILLVVIVTLTAPTDIPLAAVWRDADFLPGVPVMIYGLSAHALWYAPLYAWALLISAWSRRAPAVWLVVPPILVIAIERMIAGTNVVGALIAHRFSGAMSLAFDDSPASRAGNIESVTQLEPLRFFTSSGLWLGLLFAAAATYAAMHLRRRREPH